MRQIKVGVRETKANLSKLLERIKLGDEVIITARGKPVGKLVRISKEVLSLEERVRNLEEKGWLELPQKRPDFKISSPLSLKNCNSQRFLQEDRGE